MTGRRGGRNFVSLKESDFDDDSTDRLEIPEVKEDPTKPVKISTTTEMRFRDRKFRLPTPSEIREAVEEVPTLGVRVPNQTARPKTQSNRPRKSRS